MDTGSKKIIISCRKATELVEKKGVVGLSIGETVRLHLHTSMCKACTRYQEQSALIDRLISRGTRRPIPDDRVEKLMETIAKKFQ